MLSLRGGDFLFESGQDLSIGYDGHDGDVVRLYLEESFSFHVATPGGGGDADPIVSRALSAIVSGVTSARTRSATVSITSRPTWPGVSRSGAPTADSGSLR